MMRQVLIAAVLLAGCRKADRKQEPATPPTGSTGGAPVQPSAPGADPVLEEIGRPDKPIVGRDEGRGEKLGSLAAISIDETASVDPRAAALMEYVVPLMHEGVVACSSTAIGEHTLLTAAHCIAGATPPVPAVGSFPESITAIAQRACGHGACDTAFPQAQGDHFREDIATIWLEAALGTTGIRQLATLKGDMPGAYMLSARTGRAHPVCRAVAVDGVGEAAGFIERGDSGSAVVALRSDGTPVVLGVVSHRFSEAGRWYFALLQNALPWPAAATDARPELVALDTLDFAQLRDCP